jgi:hypothetical protein
MCLNYNQLLTYLLLFKTKFTLYKKKAMYNGFFLLSRFTFNIILIEINKCSSTSPEK